MFVSCFCKKLWEHRDSICQDNCPALFRVTTLGGKKRCWKGSSSRLNKMKEIQPHAMYKPSLVWEK